jgi:predicted Zn-dependent protease
MDTIHDNPAAQGDEQSRALLAQALAAEQAGDADGAFELLQRSLATPRPSALAHHLAGAEFAQRGDVGNAALHFTRALDAVPGLHVARLQLVLLWLTQGSPTSAAATLQPLLAASDPTSIGHFARALDSLTRDDTAAAIAALDDGIAAGNDNAALLGDMRTLRTRLAAALGGSDAELAAMRHGLAMGAYASGEDTPS